MELEQTNETTEETTTADEGGASRDELLAAVREAGGTESVDVAAEEEAAKAAGGEPAKEAPAEPDEDAKIQAILEKRQKTHAELQGAQSRAERLLQEAEQRAQKLIDEARERAQREAEETRERLRLDFKARPGEVLRQFGTPDEITDAVMREGTPEARALAKAEAEARAAREEAKDGRAAREELAQFKKELAQEKQAAQEAQVRYEYLSKHATPEKTPYLHARYEPEEIFQKSVALAHEWARGGAQYKVDFDDGTIAAYLERESKKRFTSLSDSSPAKQVPAGAPAKEPGNAPKVSANGSRTLSAAAGSERRTSPRPLNELSPQEARDELIREVEAARRANPDAKY